jgi:hypothetical protein
MENVGTFYGNLVYFKAIGNILWPFSIVCDHLVYFPPFWYVVPRKIWQPCSKRCRPRRHKNSRQTIKQLTLYRQDY